MAILDKLYDPMWWLNEMATDLYFLCRNILCTLEDPTPGYKDLYYPTHKRVCDLVMKSAKEGHKCLVLLPRHWIKSYVITIGWTIQRIIKNLMTGKREIMLVDNATIGNAKEFLSKIKYNLQYNELLRGLMSHISKEVANQLKDLENNAERWTQDEIQICGNRVELGSVEGNLVSRHQKIHIHDDLVNWENSRSTEQLTKVIDWWKLARSLLTHDGIEIIIGTRWDFGDLYGHIIDKFLNPPKDYHIGKPIVVLEKGKYHLIQMDCWADPENEKGSTFPTLFPEWKLKELQNEQEDEFPGQYRNDPLAQGRQKFQRQWIQYYKDSDIPPIVNTVVLFDVADKDKKTSDWTGCTVADIGVDKKIYIREATRKKVSDIGLIDWMIELVCAYQPASIGIESTKFNTLQELIELIVPQKLRRREIAPGYVELVQNIIPSLHELRHMGRPKETRIENMHGFVERGIVLFPRNMADDLIQELIRFGSTKIDDTADSFGYLYDVLIFPQKSDPEKVSIVSPEEKKTAEEREQEEWETIREEVSIGDQHFSEDTMDLY